MTGRQRGAVLIELIVASGILALVIAGLSAACYTDVELLEANYYRAVAIEIVDGEMETLAAGEWKAHPHGTRNYKVRADAARNLPDGKFVLTVSDKRLRLEWVPTNLRKGGRVVREARIR